MAETTTFKFDETKFKEHLTSVKDAQLKFAGKHNHNPFLWINENVLPLEEKFVKGDRTRELYDAGLALKSQPPVILVDKPEAKDGDPISVEPVNLAPKPQGLKLK